MCNLSDLHIMLCFVLAAYGEMSTVLDGRVELPCNLTLPSPDDAIHLVFWYKGNSSRVPIYTLDARASPTLWNATHFPSDSFSPNRAIFILDPFKPLGLLRIEPVREEDHSDYRCRVDFRWGRTISSLVSLHVVGKLSFLFLSSNIRKHTHTKLLPALPPPHYLCLLLSSSLLLKCRPNILRFVIKVVTT